MATERAPNPIQSNRIELGLLCSASANQMHTRAQMPGGTIMKKAARQL